MLEFRNINWRLFLFRAQKNDCVYSISWSFEKGGFIGLIMDGFAVDAQYFKTWEDTKQFFPKPNNLNEFDEQVTTFISELISKKV